MQTLTWQSHYDRSYQFIIWLHKYVELLTQNLTMALPFLQCQCTGLLFAMRASKYNLKGCDVWRKDNVRAVISHFLL